MYIEIMPGENIPEMGNQSPSIGEQIFNEFKIRNDKLVNREEMIRQVNILRQLPENLVELAYGHLQSEHTKEEIFYKNHPDTQPKPFDDTVCIEGFANEILANIQIRQTQPELRGNTDPSLRAELDNYENKILEVANNPQRFGLNLENGRNPDAAWLNLDDDGRIIINGIGEITTSPQLNKRKFLQLSESGFATNLRNIVRHLNHLNDGEKRGLPEFGFGKKRVEVSPVLKKYLVVHHDMDTSPEGLSNVIGKTVSDEEYSHLDHFSKKKVFSETERQSFLNLLTSSDTVIIKSAFSNNECHIITNLILRKIKEKFPSYQTQN